MLLAAVFAYERRESAHMESCDSAPLLSSLKLFVCTKTQCTARVVRVKLRTADTAPQELNGPALFEALQALLVEKGMRGRVWATSCMGGCPIGPRLNVVGAGGFKATVRYLHLQTSKRGILCAPWEEILSLEALLDRHMQEEEERARLMSDTALR
jgi:hypothetical protein